MIKRMVAVAALTLPLLMVGVVPAHAGSLGGIAWLPAKGGSETLITVQTERPCAPPAQRVSALLYGKGMPKDGQVVFAPSKIDFSVTQRLVLPLNNAFVIYAEDNNTALTGKYLLRVRCTDRIGIKVIDDFTATMTWKTPGNSLKNIEKATYTATNTATPDPALRGVGSADPLGNVPNPGTTTAPPGASSQPTPGAANPSPTASDATPVTPLPVTDSATPVASSSATSDSSGWVPWAAAAAVLVALAGGGFVWLRRRRAGTT